MDGTIIVKILTFEYIFITLIYALNRDFNKTIYWLGATIINIAVLRGLK